MYGACQQGVMGRWSEHAGPRLRDGEEIVAEIPFGENGVVVTNQRLLVFVPESDGANYRAIERPNVEDIRLDSDGNTDLIRFVAQGGLAGITGVLIGYTMDFGSLVSVESISSGGTSGQSGIGGLLKILNSISRLLELLDDALLVGGMLAFAVGLGAFGLYLESRLYGLWITVAGEDDEVHVPAPDDAEAEFEQLQGYLDEEAGSVSQPDDLTEPQTDPLEPD